MIKKNERKYTVLSNSRIARDIYELKLSGCVDDFTRPGQFVNIKLDGFFLRRPISVCDTERRGEDGGSGILTLVYKTVGGGTGAMSRLEKGSELDMLTALGNGFSPELCPDGCALIGGGVGCPPMYALGKELRSRGTDFSVILGFNSIDDIFYKEQFAALTDRLYICTADGSEGIRGFVTDALGSMDYKPGYICACGPTPMLAALAKTGIPGQVSLEERMGCGFGGCMGCSIMTRSGAKRVCREGPVFDISEVIWK